MKTIWTRFGLVLLAGWLWAASGAAGGEWTLLAERSPGAKPQELAFEGTIRALRIECVEGAVILNAVMIREGGARESFTIGRRLNAGESHDLDLGGERTVGGLRIHDGGRGRYRVRAR